MKAEDNKKELVPFVVTARIYYSKTTKKFDNRKKWEKPSIGEIKAALPGTAKEIKVAVGDKVKKGDELMNFEAMKMHNKVISPINGEVESINVQIGDILKKNQIMIVIREMI